MKYGKEFQHILEDSHFPPEWRSSAIEYRQLKKLIKDVVAELEGMGLSHEVLGKLMVEHDDEQQASDISSADIAGGQQLSPERRVSGRGDGDILEFEFESDEGTPPLLSTARFPSVPLPTGSGSREVAIDPILASPDLLPNPTREPRVAGPSSLPAESNIPHRKKFRLRLLSDSQTRPETEEEAPKKPIGVMELLQIREQGATAVPSTSSTEGTPIPTATRRKRVVKRAMSNGHGGVKAEYVLAGDRDHPVPQLRLHLHAENAQTSITSPVSPTRSMSEVETTSDEDEEPRLISIPRREDSPLSTPRTVGRFAPAPDFIPPSPNLRAFRTAASPIWALASGVNISDGMGDLSLSDLGDAHLSASTSAQENGPGTRAAISTESTAIPSTSPYQPTAFVSPSSADREFIVPLSSDLAFFNLLTAALSSLSAFHTLQQQTFKQSVDQLCRLVSQSIQPQNDIQVLPTPSNPSNLPQANKSSGTTFPQIRIGAKSSKKDLYAWREIFTLWIEAEIFESNAERTRGERTVEQAEMRLKKFAGEVVKRGLGDRRTMKGKKARGAWDEFLRLNVLLLDLKRFQMANINAARKILKKHDKRTALTASANFPSFVRSTLSAPGDADGNVFTWAFSNTSLPHVLLVSLTDTLLPILPSLDDYACLICTSIAFKPIRLDCSHLFCVRCLIKMQRDGKGECPLCRSKVVLSANKNSLDPALMEFMKQWFPKEVKIKQKENETELAKEQLEDSGLDTRCCVM